MNYLVQFGRLLGKVAGEVLRLFSQKVFKTSDDVGVRFRIRRRNSSSIQPAYVAALQNLILRHLWHCGFEVNARGLHRISGSGELHWRGGFLRGRGGGFWGGWVWGGGGGGGVPLGGLPGPGRGRC